MRQTLIIVDTYHNKHPNTTHILELDDRSIPTKKGKNEPRFAFLEPTRVEAKIQILKIFILLFFSRQNPKGPRLLNIFCPQRNLSTQS